MLDFVRGTTLVTRTIAVVCLGLGTLAGIGLGNSDESNPFDTAGNTCAEIIYASRHNLTPFEAKGLCSSYAATIGDDTDRAYFNVAVGAQLDMLVKQSK